jgi:hypothetical protein
MAGAGEAKEMVLLKNPPKSLAAESGVGAVAVTAKVSSGVSLGFAGRRATFGKRSSSRTCSKRLEREWSAFTSSARPPVSSAVLRITALMRASSLAGFRRAIRVLLWVQRMG